MLLVAAITPPEPPARGEGERKMKTYEPGVMARRIGGGVVLLPDDFDLRTDFDSPHSYKALIVSRTCRGVPRKDIRRHRAIRVMVDHIATGTDTTGTGDTVVWSC